MHEFVSRRRAGVTLVVVLLSNLVLMSYQKKYPDQSTLLERVIYETLSPIVVAVSNSVDSVSEIHHRYRRLRAAEERSRELEREVEALAKELERAREALVENETLGELLGFRTAAPESYIPARVISADPRSPWGAIWINRGRRDGVQRTAGVVSADGVIGKVIEVAEAASKVQLLTAAESGVGALIQRSRAVGVVGGRGAARLEMRYLSHLDDVRVGDKVVTSGLDGIFLRGLVIGEVVTVEEEPDLSKQIGVRPAAQLKNIEHVLVIARQPDAVPFADLYGEGVGEE